MNRVLSHLQRLLAGAVVEAMPALGTEARAQGFADTIAHRPVADQPCAVLLFEPVHTCNTGAIDAEHTIEPDDLERF